MEVEKDKIKDLFSSKLGNFEPEVPASVWGVGWISFCLIR